MHSRKSSARGYGKIILFGEHFVVHGQPAIVAALKEQVEVTVEKQDDYILIDKSKRFPNVPNLTWDICKPAMGKILSILKIDSPIKITLGGDLTIPNNGIGSSAAHLVALTRALSKEFSISLNDEEVNKIALEGEKVIHGTPSGIDNTAATYGGAFIFQKNKIKQIRLKKPIDIVLIESGKKTNTKEVVNALWALKKEQPEFVSKIFKKYRTLVKAGYNALIKHDLKQAGELMTENHELLKKLTLSCVELDRAVTIAIDTGALGAKLTGTGRGGLAISLSHGNQKEIIKSLKQAGYPAIKTTI